MSVRKREGSPFYWYSFTINDHRFRGSTRCTTEREAKDVERDQYQLAKRSLAISSDWTLQTVLSTYWTEHAKHTAGAGNIETHFAHFQRILGKDKKTSQIVSGDLIDYRARRRGEVRYRKDKKPVQRPLSANSVNREFAHLRAAFFHCHRFHQQPMPNVDWKGLKAKEPPWRRRFLAREDEAPALLNALPTRAREIVIAAIVTGLRRENIVSLDWDQVSLSERTITVRVKGGGEQIATIPPALMAILSTKAVRKGKVFDTTNFRRHWYAALSAAGLNNFRFHDLRHTFGSWARKAGVDLPTLKEAMHHSDISMTTRYANVTPDEVETTFDRVSATLSDTFSGTTAKKTAEN